MAMHSGKWCLLLLGVLCTTLQAQDIHRKAQPAAGSARTLTTPSLEGDEIDHAITDLLENLKNEEPGVDRQRNEKLFGGARKNHTMRNAAGRDVPASEDERIISHTVRSTDTLHLISKEHKISVELLVKHNPDLKKRPLYIGEELFILREQSVEPEDVLHIVKSGETVASLARKYRISRVALRNLNGWKKEPRLQAGSQIVVGKARLPAGYRYRNKFIMPLKGPITSGYGRRSNPFVGSRQYHNGIDIGAPIGSRVQAAGDGIVIQAARMGGYGNCIFVRHSDGFISVYGHNRKMLVQKGDTVKQGQDIAEVGRTGTATGPHLHFEIRKWAQPVNPMAAMRYQEAIPTDAAALKED